MSQIRSPSKSPGMLALSSGSLPQADSSASDHESLSSSSSTLYIAGSQSGSAATSSTRPSPSESVEIHLSIESISSSSSTPSLSSSVSSLIGTKMSGNVKSSIQAVLLPALPDVPKSNMNSIV